MLSAPINTSIVGDNVLVAASPGNIIRVTGYVLTAAGHNLLSWYSGSGQGKLLAAVALALATGQDDVFATPAGIAVPQAPRSPWGQQGWFDTNPGEALVLSLSDPQLVMGHVSYVVLTPNNISG